MLCSLLSKLVTTMTVENFMRILINFRLVK